MGYRQRAKKDEGHQRRTQTTSNLFSTDPTSVLSGSDSLNARQKSILNMQWTIGNRAVLRLLRKNAEEAKLRPQVTHSAEVGIARARSPEVEAAARAAEPVIEVARDLLEATGRIGAKELTEKGLSRMADIEHELRDLAEAGGPFAPTAQGLLEQINEVMNAQTRNAQLSLKLREARDFLGKHGIDVGTGRGRQAPSLDETEWRLRQLAETEGAEASAKRATELADELEHLHRQHTELEAAERARAGSTNAYKGGTAAKNAAKGEQKAVKAEQSLAKAEQTAVKAESAAMKAEQAAVKAETAAMKASRLAKLGSLLEMALPGPLDVLFLWIDFFGSLAEAKEKLKEEYYLEGFAAGLAASLLGFTPDWVSRHMLFRSYHGSVGERVAGFSGVREKANNAGVIAGWNFANSLNKQQRNAFRADGIATMAQQKKTIGHRTGEGKDDYDFSYDDILSLGWALKPRIEKMLELAREQEEQRQENERRKNREIHGKI